MNKRQILFLTLAVLSILLCLDGQETSAKSSKDCWKNAQSQMAMNNCASNDVRGADAELNLVYNQLLEKLEGDKVAIQALRESERAWIVYRDAQMKALHPHPEQEGSVSPMCHGLQIHDLTVERMRKLKEMLKPEEGDVCSYWTSNGGGEQ